MSNNVLNLYRVGVDTPTGEIYIYKASEVDGRALVKRPAEAEVFSAVIGNLMHGATSGASQTIKVGDEYFRLTCAPIAKEEFEAERASKADM